MSEADERPRSDERPKIRAISPAMDVPVYNIVIYLAKTDACVRARVANLPDLEFAAATEPEVLKQAITEVKLRLTRWQGQNRSIPWIDPLPEQREGELAGSWDPDTVWGGYGGRVYTTALGALCLEVFYRYLPILDPEAAQR